MTPLVSVVMPVRNGARWLSEAIASVTGQTFRDLELLAIDDGSTDDTPAILNDWSRRDDRIRVLRQGGLGLVTALNTGVAEARGAILARLDADDRSSPHRLARQVAVLQANPEIGLLGSWAERIDRHGRRVGELKPATGHDDLVQILERGNPFIHSSVALPTALVRRLGGYRPVFEAAEDYDLWLRVSEVARIANLPEFLVQYRRHGENVTASKSVRQSFSVRLAQRSAHARKDNGRDPAADLAAPPDWRSAQARSSFYAEEAARYRLLDLAGEEAAAAGALDYADFAPLVERLAVLNHVERRLAVAAMIRHMRQAAPPHAARTRRLFARMVCQRPGMALLAARRLWSTRFWRGLERE